MEFYVNHDYLCRGYDYSDRRSDHLGSTYCTYWDEYTQGMDVSGENMIKFYKNEVMSLTQEYQFCGIWQIHQAASVLGHPIYSIYPHCPVYSVRDDHNRVVLPWRTIENETVYLMWTQCSMESNRFLTTLFLLLKEIVHMSWLNLMFSRCWVLQTRRKISKLFVTSI